MSPRSTESLVIRPSSINEDSGLVESTDRSKKTEQFQIVWFNVVIQVLIHVGALYGIYCCFFAKYQTLILAFLFHLFGGLGITAGAHRLWAHRSYKAKLPVRVLLGIFQTIAAQNSIYDWCRDHRVHHKHSETDADPHNAKRGMYFAHMGWLMLRKHSDVIEKGRKIPLDDLLQDSVVKYQHKYYLPLTICFTFVLPTVLPYLLWNESLQIAYFVPGILRYVITLHITWSVNSVAHWFGHKPYDKSINPSENLLVSLSTIGEGFHNYHHTFPQDYAASEFGGYYFNFTKVFIDGLYWLGLVSDRKKISPEMVISRRMRTGDLADVTLPESQRTEHDY